jgi:hypothetical protein
MGSRLDTALVFGLIALGGGCASIEDSSRPPDFRRISAIAGRALVGRLLSANKLAGKPAPRAVLLQIRLNSPKITRKLTSEWFANGVDAHYLACLQ